MADWNETWDSDNPSDSTLANQIDDYENNLRSMLEERLQDMIYGFTAGEDTDSPGFKKITALVQASAPDTPTNAIELYGYDVSTKCELHAKDEDGDVVQMTTGGNIGGANVELLAGKDLLGSSTSDITINTDKFTVAGATGNTVVGGTLDVAGNIDPTTYEATNGGFLDEDDMVSDAADKVASQQSIKAYVDGQVDTKDFGAYTNEDDDTNAMVKAHAYLANQDGWVTAIMTAGAAGHVLNGYIGATSDPAGAGDLIQSQYSFGNTYKYSISFPVASGKYFEITDSSANATSIYWHPVGTLVKCTDQD